MQGQYQVYSKSDGNKNWVSCTLWSENTAAIAIEATSESTMLKGMMIDIIQTYQSSFSLQVNALSKSIDREMIVDTPDGKNITHAKK